MLIQLSKHLLSAYYMQGVFYIIFSYAHGYFPFWGVTSDGSLLLHLPYFLYPGPGTKPWVQSAYNRHFLLGGGKNQDGGDEPSYFKDLLIKVSFKASN